MIKTGTDTEQIFFPTAKINYSKLHDPQSDGSSFFLSQKKTNIMKIKLSIGQKREKKGKTS